MAEVRKHNEKADGLAAAVRAAIGEDVRPMVPGARDDKQDESTVQPSNVTLSMPFLTKGAESFLFSPPNGGKSSGETGGQ